MSKQIRILGIAASLCRESFNRAALRAATELVPEGATIDIFELDSIPGFNQDEEQNPPAKVVELKKRVREADAVLIRRIETMSDNSRSKDDETKEAPLREQVRQEFVDAEELGKAGREQLMKERGEPHETLPSPLDSKDDASWANINVDQLGEAVGLVYQDGEPLNTIEKIKERDDNRWSMDPASAEDFDENE